MFQRNSCGFGTTQERLNDDRKIQFSRAYGVRFSHVVDLDSPWSLYAFIICSAFVFYSKNDDAIFILGVNDCFSVIGYPAKLMFLGIQDQAESLHQFVKGV